jgi:hypothetical protein
MHFLLRAVAVCSVALLIGCSPETGPKATIEEVVPVAGTLTYKGKALENFQVTFQPSDDRRPAIGITDSAGKFKLGTNEPGDGAVTGTLKVGVVWAGPPTTDANAQEVIIDDPSKLPKPSVRIPTKYNNPETSGLVQEVPAEGLPDVKIDLK